LRGRVAVLLTADQRRGRAPEHCVKTGVATSSATKVTAVDLVGAQWWQLLFGSGTTSLLGILLRRPREVVVVNVSPAAWAIWQRRQIAAVVFGAIGVGNAVVGLFTGPPAFVVLGALVLIATVSWRAWMSWCWWVAVRLRSADGHILVHRVSSAFDADARRLFLAAQRR
jgi:hypothetical protein